MKAHRQEHALSGSNQRSQPIRKELHIHSSAIMIRRRPGRVDSAMLKKKVRILHRNEVDRRRALRIQQATRCPDLRWSGIPKKSRPCHASGHSQKPSDSDTKKREIQMSLVRKCSAQSGLHHHNEVGDSHSPDNQSSSNKPQLPKPAIKRLPSEDHTRLVTPEK